MIDKKWQIMTLLLAVVVVALSFNSLFQKPEVNIEEQLSSEEIVLENIMTRSSVRQYTGERVSEQMVETLLKAGMAAPTAGNRQPWRFYVVRDTNIIKQFTNVSKYTAPMNVNAQLAIVVCGVPAESFPDASRYWVQDASAATQNILLAAHAAGLGAVWCGVYPKEERVNLLREMISAPADYTPLNIIMVGHVDKNIAPVIKDKWKPERVFYVN